MASQLDQLLTELRRRFDALYGERLERMVLYGSQARGDAEPGSDIDVLVVLKGLVSPGEEIARTGPATAALSLRYDVVVSCTFVSADRYWAEQSPLLLNVRSDGVAV